MRWANHPLAAWVLAAVAFAVAAAGAKPFASSWNDGSRRLPRVPTKVQGLVTQRGIFWHSLTR